MRRVSYFSTLLGSLLMASPMTFAASTAIPTAESELTEVEVDANVQSAFDHMYEGACYIASGTQEVAASVCDLLWKRFPNMDELKFDVGLGSVIELAIKELGWDPGDNNPVAAVIFRDISKTVTVLLKAAKGSQVAGGSKKYDAFNVISQTTKSVSKGGGIYLLQKFGGLSAEDASEKANLYSDTLSRAIVLAGNERQEKNATKTPVPEYVVEHMSLGWGIGAILQTIPKTWVMNKIAHGLKPLRIGERINNAVYAGGALLTGLMVQRNLGVRENAQLGHDNGMYWVTAAVATSLITYSSVAAKQLITTYLFGIPGRIVNDVVNWAVPYAYLKEKGYEVYVWISPGSESSSNKDDL